MHAWSSQQAVDARCQYLAHVRKSEGLQAVDLPAPFVNAVFSSKDKEDLLQQESYFADLVAKSNPKDRRVFLLTCAVYTAQLDYLARIGEI